VISSTLSGFAFLCFIAEETGLVKPRYVVLCLAWAILAVLSQFLDLGDLTWVTSRPFVLRVELPFGLDFVYKEVERGPILFAIVIAGFLFELYLLFTLARFARRGDRKKALVLASSVSFVVVAQILDVLIGIGALQFVFLLEYGWLATILVVGLRRSNDFIEAALTRKALLKADLQLKESQATLSTIVDSTADMIWSVDIDSFSLLSFNRSFRDRFAEYRGLEVAAGMGLEELFASEDDRRQWREIYLRAKAGGSYTVERGMPGIPKVLSLSLNPLRREGGVFGLSVFGQDITERKKAEEQVRRSLDEKEVLLREVYHRTKNNMSVIISLLKLQATAVGDRRLKEAFEVSIDRIISMSMVHDKLYKSGDFSRVDLRDYIKDLADRLISGYSLPGTGPALVLEAESVPIAFDRAIDCGLIVNELITNSLKHAFPAGGKGEIRLRLARDEGGDVVLTISDDGVGPARGAGFKEEAGLGLRMVDSLARGKLGARIEFETRRGFSCKITFAQEE
jgi:PAS domain S-box-containing protein